MKQQPLHGYICRGCTILLEAGEGQLPKGAVVISIKQHVGSWFEAIRGQDELEAELILCTKCARSEAHLLVDDFMNELESADEGKKIQPKKSKKCWARK